jgi:hypothetical protein
MKTLLRRLRGALGNALVWAGAWFIAAFPLTALAPFIFRTTADFTYLGAAMFLAPTLAIIGFASGTAFSLYLRIASRDKGLSELKPGWVALGTGVTVGLLTGAFLALFVSLRGFPVELGPMILGASIFGGLSGVTALGQVKIAQKAVARGEEDYEELESGSDLLLTDPDGGVF